MNIRNITIILLILCLVIPVQANEGRDAARSFMLHSDSARVETNHLYRPIAKWSGRLILPVGNERETDGSVLIEIYSSPRRELIGTTMRLRWDSSRQNTKWFNTITADVNFDPTRKAKNLKKLVVIPTRLDGLQKVSPLESLAAARPVDDMEVELPTARLSGDSIYIREMPIQITGSHYALIQFSGPAGGGFRTVNHYNPQTGNFDGATDKVVVPLHGFRPDDSEVPVTSTASIEKSPLNVQGYYIYGKKKQGIFHVEALEPRALLNLEADKLVNGKKESLKYFKKEHFKNMTKGMTRKIFNIPRENGNTDISSVWPVGRTGFVVHLFGGRKIKGRKIAIQDRLGLHTGHFSLGMAEVVRCPITGEKRFDINYLQVYGHTTMGIISGGQKWHTYMGNLKRGWMFALPVSDTIIQLPELEPYDIGDWHTEPAKGFQRAVERMLAVYRIGGGTGISAIRTDISCVQDSHYALYAALQMFHNTFSRSEKLRTWIRENGKEHPGVKRFLYFTRLVKDLGRAISPLGIVRKDWKKNYENPIGTREPGIAGKLIRSILSARSMFPRKGYDNFVKLSCKKGYNMWTILSAQIGGDIPRITPWPATSPTSR